MATTSRLGITYPDEKSRSWFDSFTAMMGQIDEALYAGREDRNIVLSGGGTFTFSASTGVLAWTSAIAVLAPITGYQWQIAAGNVTLADGQLFYITVARGPQSTSSYSTVVGATVPNEPFGDSQLLIGWRSGSRVYFRNGLSIYSGETKSLLGPSPQGWVTVMDLDLTTSGTQSINADGNYTIGGFSFKKENSAQDRIAMALTASTGLVIQPTTSAYTNASRTAPLLWVALSQFGIVDLDVTTKFRVYVSVSATSGDGTSGDFTFAGLDSDSTAMAWWFQRGNNGSSGQLKVGVRNSGGDTGTNSTLSGGYGASNVTTRLDIPQLNGAVQQAAAYIGVAPSGSGFPTTVQGQSSQQVALGASTNMGFSNLSTGLGFVIGAAAANGTDHYSTTITRIRLDYRN